MNRPNGLLSKFLGNAVPEVKILYKNFYLLTRVESNLLTEVFVKSPTQTPFHCSCGISERDGLCWNCLVQGVLNLECLEVYSVGFLKQGHSVWPRPAIPFNYFEKMTEKKVTVSINTWSNGKHLWKRIATNLDLQVIWETDQLTHFTSPCAGGNGSRWCQRADRKWGENVARW